MLRMWLGNGYISDRNITDIMKTWALRVPESGDQAAAILLCQYFGINEDDDRATVYDKVKCGLVKVVEDANNHYNTDTKYAARAVFVLSLFKDYAEVYSIISAIDGSHVAAIRVEDDACEKLYVDLTFAKRPSL